MALTSLLFEIFLQVFSKDSVIVAVTLELRTNVDRSSVSWQWQAEETSIHSALVPQGTLSGAKGR